MEGHCLLCWPQQSYRERVGVTGLVQWPEVCRLGSLTRGGWKMARVVRQTTSQAAIPTTAQAAFILEAMKLPWCLCFWLRKFRGAKSSIASPDRRDFPVPALLVSAHAEARLKSASLPTSHGQQQSWGLSVDWVWQPKAQLHPFKTQSNKKKTHLRKITFWLQMFF